MTQLDIPAATEATTTASFRIDQLTPASDNPRAELGDLSDLVASIRSVGVLQRIVVVKRAGRLIVVAGHRRLAAAEEAGLEEVPVEIVELDEEQRQEAMLVENLHRRDLDPFEEAAGFQALAALGLSQRDIAARVGRTQPHVSKRLKLLELPAEVQDAVRSKAWPLEDALHLAKLAKKPKLVLRLFERASAPNFYGSVERMVADTIQHLEDEVKRKAVIAELEKMQTTIFEVTSPSVGHTRYLTLPADHRPVGGDWINALKLDVETHEQEPCAATAVLHDGRTVSICTDTSRHDADAFGRPTIADLGGSPAPSKTKPSPPARQSVIERGNAARDALQEAATERRQAAKAAIRHRTATDEMAWAVLEVAAGVLAHSLFVGNLALACAWLELDVGTGAEPVLRRALTDHAAGGREQLLSTVMALYAAQAEDGLAAVWHGSWDRRGAEYLEWLAEAVGYSPSEAEQAELAKVADR